MNKNQPGSFIIYRHKLYWWTRSTRFLYCLTGINCIGEQDHPGSFIVLQALTVLVNKINQASLLFYRHWLYWWTRSTKLLYCFTGINCIGEQGQPDSFILLQALTIGEQDQPGPFTVLQAFTALVKPGSFTVLQALTVLVNKINQDPLLFHRHLLHWWTKSTRILYCFTGIYCIGEQDQPGSFIG